MSSFGNLFTFLEGSLVLTDYPELALQDRRVGISGQGITSQNDLLTAPKTLTWNGVGFTYTDSVSVRSNTWDGLATKLAQLSAIAPNNLNASVLAVNETISIQNADTAPTRTINISAGDPAVVGSHFGLDYESTTNDDFVIASSSSGSILYVQTGGTTNQLLINPSQVKLQDTATAGYIEINRNVIQVINDNSQSQIEITPASILLREPITTTTPSTSEIMHNQIVLTGQNLLTPTTNTNTLSPYSIFLLAPNYTQNIANGTYETTETATNRRSSLTPLELRLGYDGTSNTGKLYCTDIDSAGNLNVVTINGLAPTTIGLIWADFANPYSSLPSNRYFLSDTTYETYQDIQQFKARYLLTNQEASYSWNGINSQFGAFTIQANSQDINLNCSTLYINGTAYSGGGGGSQDLTSTLGYGNSAGGQSITGVNNIDLSTINGSSYPPYPVAPYGLPNVLSIDANANTAINMNSNDINSVNNINVSTINGSSYPPSIPLQNKFSFQNTYTMNGTTTTFPTPTYLEAGNYAITFTIFFDGITGGGYGSEINCYVDLYSYSYGNSLGIARNSGYVPSTTISSGALGSKTCITYMDTWSLSGTDNWYINFLQNNTSGWDGNTYISGCIVKVN